MKNRFRLLLILIIFVSIALVPLLAQTKPVVTVLDFNANNISAADMKTIVSFLSSSVIDLDLFKVIDSSQRDAILAELSFSNSGCSDESCQLEIGKLLSAQFIVVGDIGLVGDRYVITAKLLETETSQAVGSAKGLYTDVGVLLDSLNEIAEELGNKYRVFDGQDLGVTEVVEAEVPEETAEVVEETPLPLVTDEKESDPVTPLSGGSSNKIVAYSTLGAGVVMLGVGSYFLIDSILKLNTVRDTQADYLAVVDPGAEFDTLYQEYLDAFSAAENSNTMLYIGAGLVGAGAISTAVSFFFFGGDEKDDSTSVAMAVTPMSFAMRVSY